MEQYYQDNRKYDGACAVPPAVTVANKAAGHGELDLHLQPRAGRQHLFLITATGQGDDSEGFQYTLDQDNNRASTMSSPSTWTGNPAVAGTVKKDGSC